MEGTHPEPSLKYRTREDCRVCRERSLELFLDLGEMPLANGFLKPEELSAEEARFPLRVAFCRSCSLMQLQDIVHPGLLFREYPYFSSASAPLVEHFRTFARVIGDRFISEPVDLMVEIGSNDGVFLQWLKGKARILGVDPAENIAGEANRRGIETLPEFFSAEVSARIRERYGPAKVIVASNVVAHVDDLDNLLAGVKTLLGDDGVFVFEVHWVWDLVLNRGFDQIYHEHVSYFGFVPLERLLRRFGFEVFDAEVLPVHGRLLRVFTRKTGNSADAPADGPSFRAIREAERAAGLNDLRTYIKFAASVDQAKGKLTALLSDLKREGRKIVGYGAPAKGNILLNYCGIGPHFIDYLTDTTPAKQGLFTPGTRIPISSPDRAKSDVPDYFLLLAWNYADAILEKEKEFRAGGGRFIIPIPEPRVV